MQIVDSYPVESAEGKVIGVITDRDICVALGTRNRPAGEVTVAEVLTGKLYSCAPDDDIHMALQTLKEAAVRRLPVISHNGTLVGVLSMDDILLRAQPSSLGKEPELSSDEVIRTFRSITQRRVRGSRGNSNCDRLMAKRLLVYDSLII